MNRANDTLSILKQFAEAGATAQAAADQIIARANGSLVNKDVAMYHAKISRDLKTKASEMTGWANQLRSFAREHDKLALEALNPDRQHQLTIDQIPAATGEQPSLASVPVRGDLEAMEEATGPIRTTPRPGFTDGDAARERITTQPGWERPTPALLAADAANAERQTAANLSREKIPTLLAVGTFFKTNQKDLPEQLRVVDLLGPYGERATFSVTAVDPYKARPNKQGHYSEKDRKHINDVRLDGDAIVFNHGGEIELLPALQKAAESVHALHTGTAHSASTDPAPETSMVIEPGHTYTPTELGLLADGSQLNDRLKSKAEPLAAPQGDTSKPHGRIGPPLYLSDDGLSRWAVVGASHAPKGVTYTLQRLLNAKEYLQETNGKHSPHTWADAQAAHPKAAPEGVPLYGVKVRDELNAEWVMGEDTEVIFVLVTKEAAAAAPKPSPSGFEAKGGYTMPDVPMRPPTPEQPKGQGSTWYQWASNIIKPLQKLGYDIELVLPQGEALDLYMGCYKPGEAAEEYARRHPLVDLRAELQKPVDEPTKAAAAAKHTKLKSRRRAGKKKPAGKKSKPSWGGWYASVCGIWNRADHNVDVQRVDVQKALQTEFEAGREPAEARDAVVKRFKKGK